jgi:hypothetical protein
MSDNKRLQESRKKSIPDLVLKYKKLVNETFDAVTKPLPTFEDRINDKDEVIATAEQQLFSFIDIRNKALDNANNMLAKVNELEIELHAPELFESDLKAKTEELGAVEPVKKNWTKANAEKNK